MADFFERLCPGIDLALDGRHPVTTDSILLARFAAPRKTDRICDLCCGMGVIPLLWFGEGEAPPRSADGVDLDPSAIALFDRSIARNGLEGSVRALEWDLRRPLSLRGLMPGSVDLVTCNPPYYPLTGSAGEDPLRAQARRELSCTLSDVCRAAAWLLRFGGRFCICHRPERLADLLEAMRAERLEPKRLRLVSHRPDRPPFLVLVEGKRGAKPSLNVLPPLFITDDVGASTAEMRNIYRMG